MLTTTTITTTTITTTTTVESDFLVTILNNNFIGIIREIKGLIIYKNDKAKELLTDIEFITMFEKSAEYLTKKEEYEFDYELNKNKNLNIIFKRISLEERIWMFRDISNIVSEAKEVEHQKKLVDYNINHDYLTKLPNRMYYLKEIDRLIKRKGNFSILNLNINKFKQINETYGQNTGDYILKLYSEKLRIRLKNVILFARLSSDEFGIICQTESIKENLFLLKEIHYKPLLRENIDAITNLYITSSIGIASFPIHGKDSEKMLQASNLAMLEAKKINKDYKYYNEEIRINRLNRLTLKNEIKEGIYRNEFVFYYQPQIEITTKTIVGMEALVRWNHPLKGIIYPLDFLAVAEENNLLLELDRKLIEFGIKELVKLKSESNYKGTMSFNFSTKQLMSEDFYGYLKKVLEENKCNPQWIKLEITETELMTDIKKARIKLEKIKLLDIKIALDDFGTGYSSLEYLTILPIDSLKIDKVFVDKIDEGHNDYILKTIIGLSKQLKLEVIAEGVETERQLDFLKKIGCDIIQGYFYEKPLKLSILKEKYFKIKK